MGRILQSRLKPSWLFWEKPKRFPQLLRALRELLPTYEPVRHTKPFAKTRKGWKRRQERKFVRSIYQLGDRVELIGEVQRVVPEPPKRYPTSATHGWY